MSTNLKLLAGTVVLAGIALATFVHVQSSQGVAQKLTLQVFTGGIQPLVALEQAYGRITVMEARYALPSAQAGGSQTSVDLVAGLGDILSDLGEAGSSVPQDAAIAEAIGNLRYAVSRLKAAEGDVSDRFLLRELGVISGNLSQTLALLRADTRAMRDEAGFSFVHAERSHVTGLFALLLALVLFAWMISADVSWRIRRAVGALRAIEAGEEPGPATEGSPPFRDLFRAISGLNAKLGQDRREAEQAGAAMSARLEREIERLEKHFEVTIDKMQEGYCLLDEKLDLVAANAPFRRLFSGLKPGAKAQDLIDEPALEPILSARAPGVLVQETRDGRMIEVRRHAASGRSTIIIVDDVTEKHAASRTIERLSGCDPLTGLPNRTRFYEHLGTILSGRGPTSGFAVLCLDIQGFQEINAAHGGGVGDIVLRTAAERLAGLLGEGDFLARIGADEFAILQAKSAGPQAAQTMADAILAAFEAPFALEGSIVAARMAIGMVHVERPRGRGSALDPHAVMRDAEMALANARLEKRGGVCLFSEAIRLQADERRQLEADLRQALAGSQFELHYQPFADVVRGAVSGFEALIRWNHPERGAIPPARFIPVAEEIGLIDEIGAWVTSEACHAASKWPSHLIVSVNLSAIQFRSPQIVDDIKRTLRASGLAPERLQLEVTESVFLDDVEETLLRLSALRALGVTISMDDFGTGYSSLGYLSRFPFDKLKIDQGFVRDMNKPENAAIIRAVVGLSSSMKIGVIAEGVETREQFETLREEGCGEMQGYFLGRPAPASQLARHLARIDGAFASGALARAIVPANASRSA